jgi:outer membrane protein insertion porin family
MNKPAALLAAFLLCCLLLPAQKRSPPSARKTAPARTIRFQGAPQYTQEELLAASGLKPDARLTTSEVKAHAKQLNDTGLFTVIKFGSDSKGLLFTLTPSSQLFPIHLDNLPLKSGERPGKELDDELHARFPLYHGLVPANGSILEGICRMFEEMLAAEGAKAKVNAAVTSGVGPQKITAMNFTITSPTVRIGPIQLTGVSAAMQAKVDSVVSSQSGNAFDTENSAPGLQRAFEDLYQDQGYAAVQAEVNRAEPLLVSDQSIQVPYSVAIKEGGVYKLGSIGYPADALVPRAEVDKAVKKTGAGAGRPLDLFVLAVRDSYHARGHLDCSVTPHASFNEATHIVNYTIEIVPGAEYRMGSVQFDGAPDAVQAKLRNAWRMTPGATFDESYVSTFAARAQKQDKALAKWMQMEITTFDVKADPETHQVSCVFHFVKAAGSGR